ncbi:hypothetical protein QFZ75_008057 [Streptomyces sp. V3I8]|uniref:hypothetical protein n=1 Tax=Streptomyces sp. V3I8 TaxID=3042279 RepID=UPI00278649A3|nr:hypothetical protein [Streptomyces sp. V3I8]MDQ1041555.1 hypothetical protein [Streptomyces sp. V3I8]
MNLLTDSAIGVRITYRPTGAFLPVEREFPWANPDDVVFIIAAFSARQHRSLRTRSDVVAMLKEARDSQIAWHEDRMRMALVHSLGRWAKVVPSRLVDRLVQASMKQYYEATAHWALELGELYEQVNELSSQVGTMRRAQRPQSKPPTYGPQVLCEAPLCTRQIPLARPLVLPEGWTADERNVPRCPEHSAADVMTSKVGA